MDRMLTEGVGIFTTAVDNVEAVALFFFDEIEALLFYCKHPDAVEAVTNDLSLMRTVLLGGSHFSVWYGVCRKRSFPYANCFSWRV